MNPAGAKITGVVLAGGRGRRMGGQDKGLVPFHGKPLAAYAAEALKQVTDRVLISANRNREVYARLGYPVVADAGSEFDGPLAGLLAALRVAETRYVMCVPCDSPLLRGQFLWRLYDTLAADDAEVCAAQDGQRLHPVFMIVERSLASSLEDYLAGGGRKVEAWLHRHRLVLADYSDHPEIFVNINSADDLAQLETGLRGI